MTLNCHFFQDISKLPIRQVTLPAYTLQSCAFSKLPIRQVTASLLDDLEGSLSKLPIRQVTLN